MSALSSSQSEDLYGYQSKYSRYIHKKKKIYSILCLILAVVNLVSCFVLPLFEYDYRRKGNSRKGIESFEIRGKYTHLYLFEKFSDGGLGEKNSLNTFYMIFLALIVLMEVILIVASLLNLVAKDMMREGGFVSKVFNYGMVEIYSTLMVVFLVAAMICGKVDVSGGASNGIGFWINTVATFFIICFSIPLSDK